VAPRESPFPPEEGRALQEKAQATLKAAEVVTILGAVTRPASLGKVQQQVHCLLAGVQEANGRLDESAAELVVAEIGGERQATALAAGFDGDGVASNPEDFSVAQKETDVAKDEAVVGKDFRLLRPKAVVGRRSVARGKNRSFCRPEVFRAAEPLNGQVEGFGDTCPEETRFHRRFAPIHRPSSPIFVVSSLPTDELQAPLGKESDAFTGFQQAFPLSVTQSAGREGDVAIEEANSPLTVGGSPLFRFRVVKQGQLTFHPHQVFGGRQSCPFVGLTKTGRGNG
jgi:hypothetical protein